MALDGVLDRGGKLQHGVPESRYEIAALNAGINWDNPDAYSTPGAPPNGSDYIRLRDGAGNYLQARRTSTRSPSRVPGQLEPVPVEWTVTDGCSGPRHGCRARGTRRRQQGRGDRQVRHGAGRDAVARVRHEVRHGAGLRLVLRAGVDGRWVGRTTASPTPTRPATSTRGPSADPHRQLPGPERRQRRLGDRDVRSDRRTRGRPFCSPSAT